MLKPTHHAIAMIQVNLNLRLGLLFFCQHVKKMECSVQGTRTTMTAADHYCGQ